MTGKGWIEVHETGPGWVPGRKGNPISVQVSAIFFIADRDWPEGSVIFTSGDRCIGVAETRAQVVDLCRAASEVRL